MGSHKLVVDVKCMSRYMYNNELDNFMPILTVELFGSHKLLEEKDNYKII